MNFEEVPMGAYVKLLFYSTGIAFFVWGHLGANVVMFVALVAFLAAMTRYEINAWRERRKALA